MPTAIIDRPRDTESAVRACLKFVRGFRPDIFVANHVLAALYAGGWIRRYGIPTLGVWHNDDEEYRAKNSIFAAGANFFQVTSLVTISTGLSLHLKSDGSSVPPRCIRYGLPPLSETSAWEGSSPLRLVYHGRLVQHQKRILETTAALVRVARNNNVSADIYGSGPEREAVREMLVRDNAAGRVSLRGQLSAAEVLSTLPAYHVAVLLSDFEGLGLSILEAMACGLVPVCHRTASGLPDIIQSGENGFFVDDREGAFDKTISLLSDSLAEWKRLSSAARATVRERFSQTASIEAWEELFDEIRVGGLPTAPLTVPRKIELPPPHPALRSEDPRHPGLLRDVWRRLRFPRK